jgi:hypothetical protein
MSEERADAPEQPAGGEGGERVFEHRGRTWLARVSGHGALGTGSLALGLIDAIHFADPAEPQRPLREALLPRGRFADLYELELAELCERAKPVDGARSR